VIEIDPAGHPRRAYRVKLLSSFVVGGLVEEEVCEIDILNSKEAQWNNHQKAKTIHRN
jgi:hypothetical protein